MKNYLLHDMLIKDHNDAPFQACKALLTLLGIEYELVKNAKNDMGSDLRYKKNYHEVFKSTLEEAKEKNSPLIALENSSYLGLKYSAKAHDIKVDILHVNDILAQMQNELVHNFSNFNVAIYYGSNDESLNQKSLLEILNFTKAKSVRFERTYAHDGFEFLDFNKALAYKMAGEILFSAYDSACDFLVMNDIRSFHIFDTHQKRVAKAYGRSLSDGLPILSAAQVLLMALGKTKLEENLTSLHVIKPNFI